MEVAFEVHIRPPPRIALNFMLLVLLLLVVLLLFVAFAGGVRARPELRHGN